MAFGDQLGRNTIVNVPDKFVDSAVKDTYGLMDSSARLQARSLLLVATSPVNTKQKAIQLRLLNPTKWPRTVDKEAIADSLV